MNAEIGLTITSTVLSLLIAGGGYKKKSLSFDGAITACILGFLTFMTSLKFGILLICFFISSSILTKFGSKKKKQLESDFKEGGQRDSTQVISNSFAGIIICIYWVYTYGLQYSFSSYNASVIIQSLTAGFICHYACCCGDTWASEIGSLSKSPPFFILNPFRTVTTGTNGGVSILGLLASLGGGIFIGFIAGFIDSILMIIHGDILVVTNIQNIVFWTIYGGIFGLLGSLIDSILGATLQLSLVDTVTGKIVNGNEQIHHILEQEKKNDTDSDVIVDRKIRFVPVSGYDILDNHAVNLLSSLLTSIIGFVTYLYITA